MKEAVVCFPGDQGSDGRLYNNNNNNNNNKWTFI